MQASAFAQLASPFLENARQAGTLSAAGRGSRLGSPGSKEPCLQVWLRASTCGEGAGCPLLPCLVLSSVTEPGGLGRFCFKYNSFFRIKNYHLTLAHFKPTLHEQCLVPQLRSRSVCNWTFAERVTSVITRVLERQEQGGRSSLHALPLRHPPTPPSSPVQGLRAGRRSRHHHGTPCPAAQPMPARPPHLLPWLSVPGLLWSAQPCSRPAAHQALCSLLPSL